MSLNADLIRARCGEIEESLRRLDRLRAMDRERFLAGCFGALGSAGIILPDLASRLQQMARFRNLLVHVYWRIDYGRVYDVLEHDLGDLRAFVGVVSQLV